MIRAANSADLEAHPLPVRDHLYHLGAINQYHIKAGPDLPRSISQQAQIAAIMASALLYQSRAAPEGHVASRSSLKPEGERL